MLSFGFFPVECPRPCRKNSLPLRWDFGPRSQSCLRQLHRFGLARTLGLGRTAPNPLWRSLPLRGLGFPSRRSWGSLALCWVFLAIWSAKILACQSCPAHQCSLWSCRCSRFILLLFQRALRLQDNHLANTRPVWYEIRPARRLVRFGKSPLLWLLRLCI